MSHYCRTCGKTDPDTYFRPGGTGKPRADCVPCERKKDDGRKHRAAGSDKQALVPINQFRDVPIHTGAGRGVQFVEGGPLYVALADVCEFFGVAVNGQARRLLQDPNYQPAIEKAEDMFGFPGSAPWFIRADKVSGWLHLINPNKVKPECREGLIAYRDVCDRVLSDYMLGTKTAPPAPIVTPYNETHAIEQIKEGLMVLLGPTVEQLFTSAFDRVLTDRFGLMPQQVAETHETLQGVTVIERERERLITDEWMAVGQVYLAVEPNKGLMTVGSVKGTKTPEQRMCDSDYNGDKGGDGAWRPVWSFWTDNLDSRAGAEVVMIGIVARAGVERVTARGTFRYDARVESDFRRLPRKIRLDNLRRLIERDCLFRTPLELL